MSSSNTLVRYAVRSALLSGSAAAVMMSQAVHAQDQPIQEVIVTGTRIQVPNAVSSSPIFTIGAEEIRLQQQPEVEKILRVLPITAPGDGQNANNGTDGAATVNLRNLGEQRNLILINGKRMTPYSFDGLVDTSMIPTALIERVDIVTGGASAVYGSDAISGALNFIMKRDFEGVEITSDFSQTGDGDGDIKTVSATLGSNLADGRGNIVVSMNWSEREGVQLGARPLGMLGIGTADGSNYEQFLNGQPPVPAPAGCGGPNSVASGGSGTTLPTRVSIAGGPGLGQFREDGSLGANCSVFNFNPYNYYQTPQERFGGVVMGNFEVNEHADAYASFTYSKTTVRQQVAPSGVFFDTLWTPLANPFITASARADIIAAAEAGRLAGSVNLRDPNDSDIFENWRDSNNNGVVDEEDYLNMSYGRRTVEFGPRSTNYDSNLWQLMVGTRGEIMGDWTYDLSYQYGESNRTTVEAGYTNLTNIGNALDSVDGVNCANGQATCVPINLFGGFGAITPEMAAYSSGTGVMQQNYKQNIISGAITGPINALHIPAAANPIAVSLGAEYRYEAAETTPDECLKLAPASCLGGRGGYTLPTVGSFNVKEIFGEVLVPLVNDMPGVQALDVELGFRYSDYNITGSNETYKYGLSWRPVDQLLVRVMRQRAVRAPNIGELFGPYVASLDNATLDPCSIENAGNITPALADLCVATGMRADQVGNVMDIVSGQVNVFSGTDPNAKPTPEEADTTTVGVVWTGSDIGVFRRPMVSVDYYNVDIENVIDSYTAQQVMDGCYVAGSQSHCDKIIRVGGDLVLPGSGVELLTTNLKYLQAEGVEVGFGFGIDLGRFGSLDFMGNVNKYLTQESDADETTPTLDCVGYFGTSCQGPLPTTRWMQRTTWNYDAFSLTALWRHLGSVSVEPLEREGTFERFRKIDSYNYIDMYASWQPIEMATVSLGVTNVFDKDPPVVGNEAADTRSNSGNTFPSMYDTLGRVFTLGVRLNF